MKASHIRNLIRNGEETKLEWKDSSILSNPFKLARSMAATANNEGGLVLIGVKDDGTFEGMAGMIFLFNILIDFSIIKVIG